jgi:hypothetical protein
VRHAGLAYLAALAAALIIAAVAVEAWPLLILAAAVLVLLVGAQRR